MDLNDPLGKKLKKKTKFFFLPPVLKVRRWSRPFIPPKTLSFPLPLSLLRRLSLLCYFCEVVLSSSLCFCDCSVRLCPSSARALQECMYSFAALFVFFSPLLLLRRPCLSKGGLIFGHVCAVLPLLLVDAVASALSSLSLSMLFFNFGLVDAALSSLSVCAVLPLWACRCCSFFSLCLCC